jgi:hypothetical protein
MFLLKCSNASEICLVFFVKVCKGSQLFLIRLHTWDSQAEEWGEEKYFISYGPCNKSFYKQYQINQKWKSWWFLKCHNKTLKAKCVILLSSNAPQLSVFSVYHCFQTNINSTRILKGYRTLLRVTNALELFFFTGNKKLYEQRFDIYRLIGFTFRMKSMRIFFSFFYIAKNVLNDIHLCLRHIYQFFLRRHHVFQIMFNNLVKLKKVRKLEPFIARRYLQEISEEQSFPPVTNNSFDQIDMKRKRKPIHCYRNEDCFSGYGTCKNTICTGM